MAEMKKCFSFQNGFDYEEFKDMCNSFKKVKLHSKMKSDLLLTDYIFCLAMRRISIDKRSILKRLAASVFDFQVRSSVIGTGKIAFIFTGNQYMRPDYLQCVENTATQARNSTLFLIDRKSTKLSIRNIIKLPFIFIWANRLNAIVRDRWISLDMAVSVFRSVNQANFFINAIKKFRCEKVVTFCDQWSIDNALTQLAITQNYPTATLQHGNGNEIFAGFCSNYYLANSMLSKINAIQCGISEKQIVVVGPMKYAGFQFEYGKTNVLSKIGIVFDGLDNFKNNLAMLKSAHQVAEHLELKCYIRFHPSNKREEYAKYLSDTDVICDDLKEFEMIPDFYITYISTMYTDMLFKKRISFRYATQEPNMFTSLTDTTFSNADELEAVVINARENYAACLEWQKATKQEIFGADEGVNQYQKFFKVWGES